MTKTSWYTDRHPIKHRQTRICEMQNDNHDPKSKIWKTVFKNKKYFWKKTRASNEEIKIVPRILETDVFKSEDNGITVF